MIQKKKYNGGSEDYDDDDTPIRNIRRSKKYREKVNRPWHIVLMQGLREIFSPEGVNVFEYQDNLEQEIEMDSRYNTGNIIVAVILIILAFVIIGFIIYYIYIFVNPPIGNDLKEIFKTVSSGDTAIKNLKSLHINIPRDRLDHIKSFDELAFILNMPGGGEKTTVDCMSMKGGTNSNITFNPVPPTAYAPGTQIYNPGIVTNSVDTYKSFGISSNMMKIKIASFFRKFIYNNENYAVFKLPKDWATSSFFGSIPNYKLKELSDRSKNLLSNFLSNNTTEADFLF